MADVSYIHDDIKLYTTAEKFYLEPTMNPTEVMVIDRITGEATVQAHSSVQIPIPEHIYKPVCGFLGTIKLLSGNYLVLAKYRVLVGKINGHDVYQLAGHELISYARSDTHLTSKQSEHNATYERMARLALAAPGLYFTYGGDLTHSLQRLHAAPPDFRKMSLARRADPRFLWNGHLLKPYMESSFARFALPLVQGFVAVRHFNINGHSVAWALVSRRSVHRAGARLLTRGEDAQGNVANFVETEQIVERGGDQTSFVQIRGSIPLFWTQYPNIKYKPSPKLSQEDHLAAYTRHMRDTQERYGNIVLINLIDHAGSEGALERAFSGCVAAAALPGARYEPFDFHAECRRLRYDRLAVLTQRLQHEQDEFAYLLTRGGTTLQRQSGTFRTNCVDCLDRTNVVQSLLAARQLRRALDALCGWRAELPDGVRAAVNNVWADHADMISVQYSGTGALKTDFTRTGKRTRAGLLRDGANSLTRYYLNNFCDGFRQDSIDLLLGNYQVTEGEGNTAACPLARTYDWQYYTFPSMLLVAVSMLCAGAVLPLPRAGGGPLLWLLLWGAAVGASLTYIVRNGAHYVDTPRLVHPLASVRGARRSL